jgi:type III secretion system low calcium response chaperone LcrH/SycD
MPLEDFDNLNLKSKIKSCFKDKDKLRRALREGKSAQQILGVTQEQMTLLHQAARALLEGGKFQDAANAFLFLATLHPKGGDYWIGLGLSLSKQGDLEGAKDAYELATLCEDENPLPYFHLAKILFSMNDREATLEALDWTLALAGDEEKFREIKEEAKKAKKILEKKSSRGRLDSF